jgi:hypothetical protein
VIDLTTATRKNEIALTVSREIDAELVAKVGLKARADRSYSCNTSYRYLITLAMARKVIAAYGSKVTYYGEPLAA